MGIGKYIENESVALYQIFQFQPTAMVKVFKGYNDWLHAQIDENYYLHPLIAEKEKKKMNESGYYSEPILNLIDDDESDGNVQLIEGNVDEQKNDLILQK